MVLKTNKFHARFSILSWEHGKAIILKDLGPWEHHKTITNDAEYVLDTLFEASFMSATTRVFYFDSYGRQGEILHNDGVLLGFSR